MAKVRIIPYPRKWNHPGDWLEERAKTWSKEKLYEAVIALSSPVWCDGDTIMAAFDKDMEADGYFEIDKYKQLLLEARLARTLGE